MESGSASMAMPVRITESEVRFSESKSCTWLMLRLSDWLCLFIGLFGQCFGLGKVDFTGAVLRPMSGNVIAHGLLVFGLGVFEDAHCSIVFQIL